MIAPYLTLWVLSGLDEIGLESPTPAIQTRDPSHGRNGGPPGGPRLPKRAGATMGAVATKAIATLRALRFDTGRRGATQFEALVSDFASS